MLIIHQVALNFWPDFMATFHQIVLSLGHLVVFQAPSSIHLPSISADVYTLGLFWEQMMAVATFCMGALPTYATIGPLAPAALLIVRCFQGVSTGGQLVGSFLFTVEAAPAEHKCLFGAVCFATVRTLLLAACCFLLFRQVNLAPTCSLICKLLPCQANLGSALGSAVAALLHASIKPMSFALNTMNVSFNMMA